MKRQKRLSRKQEFKKNYQLYLFLLPAVVSVFLFNYLPMYGIQIAFKDFKPAKGVLGSEWVGMKWFDRFFSSFQFNEVLSNTLLLSVLLLLCSFPVPIIFALLVNQYKEGKFRRTLQTVSYAPHFISTVVMVGMVVLFLSPSAGLYGTVVRMLGGDPRNILGEAAMFRPIYILSDIWQHTGWDSIIYLAAFSSIDPGLYEAASIDGANRFQKMIHISWPGIRGTVCIMLILAVGSLMTNGASFDQVFNLYSAPVYSVADTIDTYVYRGSFGMGMNFGYTTAIGFLKSIINIILITMANKIVTKSGEAGLF